MFKKLASVFGLWIILASVFATTVLAFPILTPNIIQSITLTAEPNSTPQTFEPAAEQVLKTTVVFDNTLAAQLANSTGYVKVKHGNTVIKTLATWTNANPPNVPDWNGKDIDVDAEDFCGDSGAICPSGNYKVEVEVEYTDVNNNTPYDVESSDFKIYPPAINITNLVVN